MQLQGLDYIIRRPRARRVAVVANPGLSAIPKCRVVACWRGSEGFTRFAFLLKLRVSGAIPTMYNQQVCAPVCVT